MVKSKVFPKSRCFDRVGDVFKTINTKDPGKLTSNSDYYFLVNKCIQENAGDTWY